jgi:multiple sugar transport system ATP-binding protein
MRIEIAKLHKELGATMVYVTHDQVEAMTLADRIVIMKDGRIEQIGTPMEVYEKPANLFVAGFIGAPAMNLLTGKAASGVATAGPFSLPSPLSGDVVLGVRPDDFTQDPSGFEAKVIIVEPLGSEAILTVTAEGQELVVKLGARDMAALPKPGDSLTLGVLPGKIHLFDAKSGHAIRGR